MQIWYVPTQMVNLLYPSTWLPFCFHFVGNVMQLVTNRTRAWYTALFKPHFTSAMVSLPRSLKRCKAITAVKGSLRLNTQCLHSFGVLHSYFTVWIPQWTVEFIFARWMYLLSTTVTEIVLHHWLKKNESYISRFLLFIYPDGCPSEKYNIDWSDHSSLGRLFAYVSFNWMDICWWRLKARTDSFNPNEIWRVKDSVYTAKQTTRKSLFSRFKTKRS